MLFETVHRGLPHKSLIWSWREGGFQYSYNTHCIMFKYSSIGWIRRETIHRCWTKFVRTFDIQEDIIWVFLFYNLPNKLHIFVHLLWCYFSKTLDDQCEVLLWCLFNLVLVYFCTNSYGSTVMSLMQRWLYICWIRNMLWCLYWNSNSGQFGCRDKLWEN